MIQPLTYHFGDYRLDRAARELRRNGEPVPVPTRVFDCLVYLIENRDRAIGRDELVAALWGRVDVSDAQLGQIVLRARRAVGDDGNDQRCIRTMPKYGYRWMAETRVEAAERAEARAPSPDIEAVADDPVAEPSDAAIERASAAEPRESARPRRTGWRWLVAAVVVLAVALATYAFRDRLRPAVSGESAARAGLAVLPVDVAAGPSQDWVRLGGMDALASRLRAAGLRVPPSESVLAAVQAGRTSDPAMREATSAELVVHTELTATPQGWRAELSAHPAGGEAIVASAEGREVLPTLRRGADQLLLRMGRAVPDQGSTESGLDETLQRAEAALLANQLDIARAILMAAPDLARSAPELRYRLALIDFRAGRLREVESALQSILDDRAASDNVLLRARALTGLGTIHLNLGRFEDSEREFGAAVDALGAWQRPLERGQALGGRGAARAAQGRYAEAADDLGRARIELQQAGDALGTARLDMVVGELELQRRHPAAARPSLERAIAAFERFDAVNERLHSLALLVACERSQLDYAAALASSDRAMEFRARATDPQLRTEILVARSELLVDLGRYVEARALLDEIDRAPPPAPPSLAEADRARAELALATKAFDAAVEHADAALARLTAPTDASARGWLAHVRARAELGRDRHDAAREALAKALASESAPAREELGYRLAAAELAEPGDADAAFAAALASADAEGVEAHVVAVASAYAEWLLARDRTQDARAVVGRLAQWADRDYGCALLQLELFHRLGQTASWSVALGRAEKLAGEREIPAALRMPPSA